MFSCVSIIHILEVRYPFVDKHILYSKTKLFAVTDVYQKIFVCKAHKHKHAQTCVTGTTISCFIAGCFIATRLFSPCLRRCLDFIVGCKEYTRG